MRLPPDVRRRGPAWKAFEVVVLCALALLGTALAMAALNRVATGEWPVEGLLVVGSLGLGLLLLGAGGLYGACISARSRRPSFLATAYHESKVGKALTVSSGVCFLVWMFSKLLLALAAATIDG